MLNDHAATIENSADRNNFVTLTTRLHEYAQPYVKVSGLIGSGRALTFFLDLFIGWISVERWFCDGISYADAVDNLRKPNKEEFETVINICRSHSYLNSTSKIVKQIMSVIEEGSRIGGLTNASSVHKSLTGAESLLEAEACLY